MEHLIANIAGKTRREQLHGKEYLVAPMTLIVPGVLNGSQGRLFYPPEEVANNVQAWNGMPLTLNHPTLNGSPISGRTPSVLESSGLGFVFNAEIKDGKLSAEAWFEVDLTSNRDNRIINWVTNGTPVEISTGLFTDKEPAEKDAVYNGQGYDYIARNYRPDHLAILPDQIGACSIQDGCGLLVNQRRKDCKCGNTISEGCSCDGPPYVYQTENKRFVVHTELTSNELSHSDLHSALSSALRGQFKQSDPSAWVMDVFETYFVYEQGEKLYKLSYSVSGGSVSLGSETPQEVVRETNFVVTANEEENSNMAKSTKTIVDQVITNCSCWSEEDREVLTNLGDEKLKGFLSQEAKLGEAEELIANTAAKDQEEEEEPAEPDPSETTENKLASLPVEVQRVVQNAMRIEAKAKKAIIEKLTANKEGEELKTLTATLNAMELEQLEGLELLAPAAKEEELTGNQSVSSFFVGNGGGPRAKSGSSFKAAPLVPPTINFEDVN